MIPEALPPPQWGQLSDGSGKQGGGLGTHAPVEALTVQSQGCPVAGWDSMTFGRWRLEEA